MFSIAERISFLAESEGYNILLHQECYRNDIFPHRQILQQSF
nr:MAG TPA: hypothetical protein [Caudoviricetes sp.]